MLLTVAIEYEDGRSHYQLADQWPYMRADGVQRITLACAGKRAIFHAASLYWLYADGDSYIAGSGSIRYDPNPLTEIVIAPDGTQTERHPEYMPDLKHSQIKLGWWRRG